MGDTSLEWSSWVASIGPALTAATIWTVLLATGARGLDRSRRSYQHGLAAGVVAYLAMLGVTSGLLGLWQQVPAWIAIVLLAPVIEESARLLLANEVRNDPPAWLAFGIGYGLFEAGLKLGDTIAWQVREPMHPAGIAIGLVGPVVPLLLHVFLSVLVFALLRRGVALPVIWIVAVALHGLHNWSIQAFLPSEWLHLAGGLLLRSAIFLALIAMLLPLSRRSLSERAQMTSAP